MYYGSIEAGGTKFVCAVADEKLSILERVSFPTTSPKETMEKVFEFFDRYSLSAIGIGSFGPIDVDPNSSTYGYITNTPKLLWRNFDFLGTVKERYNIPVAWTTDVNAAAYGEYYQGVGKGRESCLYLTVGTGIGGGFVRNGELFQGKTHPEMGHISVKMHPNDEENGICPSHGSCLEGLASGYAIEQRYECSAKTLGEDHSIWEFEAYYLAQALWNYTLILTPSVIVLGGGVMKQEHLIDKVRKELDAICNDYIMLPNLEKYVVTPVLGDDQATIGCFLLAKEALKNK